VKEKECGKQPSTGTYVGHAHDDDDDEENNGPLLCKSPLYHSSYIEDDFEGAPFMSEGLGPNIRSRFQSIPSAGNSKTFKLVKGMKEGVPYINWRENLQTEVFRLPAELMGENYLLKPDYQDIEINDKENSDSWLADPTRAVILTLNFFNLDSSLVFEVKIVIAKTELGLYSLFLATNRFRLPIK